MRDRAVVLCVGDWRGCYRSQWDLWSPESYAHPAKMAPGLAFRILEHLEERGLLQQGSVILDPMAGISTSLLAAYMKGYASVGVELEPKFVALSEQNIKRLVARRPGLAPEPHIIQGDARNLLELLGGPTFYEQNKEAIAEGTVALLSPPYAKTLDGQGADAIRKRIQAGRYKGKRPDVWLSPRNKAGSTYGDDYGTSPGNIGNLPDHPLVTLTSPPYDGEKGNSPSSDTTEIRASRNLQVSYGHASGQLGPLREESYLQAMAQVYAEISKVASVLAVVVKDPTRGGKLRLLGEDTARLLEATGWEIVCRHHAILFEESEQGDLMGGSVKKPRGRLSFFKRLNYQAGRPVAAFEHVLIATERPQCPTCQRPMTKDGKHWSGHNRVQRWLCGGCGRRTTKQLVGR